MENPMAADYCASHSSRDISTYTAISLQGKHGCACREYNGNARQRFSVASMKPLDYVKEARMLLDRITAMAA